MSLRALAAAITRIFHRLGPYKLFANIKTNVNDPPRRQQSWNFASGSFRLFNRERPARSRMLSRRNNL